VSIVHSTVELFVGIVTSLSRHISFLKPQKGGEMPAKIVSLLIGEFIALMFIEAAYQRLFFGPQARTFLAVIVMTIAILTRLPVIANPITIADKLNDIVIIGNVFGCIVTYLHYRILLWWNGGTIPWYYKRIDDHNR
jgi:hypothetical protein